MTLEISATRVRQLRDATGAGFQDCRTALLNNDADLARAIAYLSKKGAVAAAEKAERPAREGVVEVYRHHTGRLGILVEVACETDFVARNDRFRKFTKDLALHVANQAPQYVTRGDIPQIESEHMRSTQRQRTIAEGKKEAIIDKIVDGRMEKWYRSLVLMEQPWLHDDKLTVSEVVSHLIVEIGENIVIRRFVRFELGDTPKRSEAE